MQGVGAIFLVSAVVVAVFSSHAGASGLSNGVVTLQDASGSIATSPLSSHQLVTVSVGPNSTLSQSSLQAAGFPDGVAAIRIVMCADPGGQPASLPTDESDCEPATIDPDVQVQENGSINEPGYEVFALPDTAELGISNGTLCDLQHECVLGLFSNQHDFSKPHLFSAPFAVGPTSASSGTTSTSTPAASTSSNASAAVTVAPATLANTGGPILWPWLLGVGAIMLLAGTALRSFWRSAAERRR
jgi:hypothetical protein